MKIVGIQKNSFVDYPGKIAAVAFTPGCNMNCFYCHNRHIIEGDMQQYNIDPQEFLTLLEKRKGFIDGAVISGGEPTLQPDLEKYITDIKQLGYAVKLDTNGTHPHVIRSLIEKKLVDYIAMDIKAPLHKYEEICGTSVDLVSIEESIALMMQGEVDYEFRTTFVPQLSCEDGLHIAKQIKGARRFVLQQFRRPKFEEEFVDKRMNRMPHSDDVIVNIGEQVKGYVQGLELRGVV